MISFPEIRRRVVWLWRLAASAQVSEVAGNTAALWIYDTLKQPDGRSLAGSVLAVARAEGLKLLSFGPRPVMKRRVLMVFHRFLNVAPVLFASNFDLLFEVSVRKQIEEILLRTQARVVVVGSCRGTFAKAVTGSHITFEIWEVQHGLLDATYFPVRAERFYARSSVSAAILREFSPAKTVIVCSEDLKPPAGEIVPFDQSRVRAAICYSKNPGGGCSARELMAFEVASSRLSKRLRVRFCLRLHPRDNLLKLIARHRSLRPMRWVLGRRRLLHDQESLLVISAFSTALISNSKTGNQIVNVNIGTPGDIVSREYSWIPTVTSRRLEVLSDADNVFSRT